MKMMIALLGSLLVASPAVALGPLKSRITCSVTQGTKRSSAEYTFVLSQYTDRWNMSCTASSQTNGEGSSWLGMRFGRGEFGHGPFQDQPICVAAHPTGIRYTFDYDRETNTVEITEDHRQPIKAQCQVATE